MAVTKKPSELRNALRIATCTLLSSAVANTQADEPEVDWLVDGAVLQYSEKDRVKVIEPVISFRKYIQFDEFKEYKFTVDTMTGASPNGASPSNVPQTFTGSSGSSGYSVDAGVTPMREFSDTRISFNYTSEKPLDNELRATFGSALSVEEDYASLGLNTSRSKDFNNKHTTLTGSAGVSLDLVYPSGGAPTALANVNTPSNSGGGGGDDDDDEHEGEGGDDFDPEFKGMVDVLFGVTQIINRYALIQLNYSHGFIRGYLTDPYKVVSVVDSITGEPSLTPTTTNGVYLNEKRPDSRDTNSVYWKTVVSLGDDVLRVSYRYFWDDWGIKSNTVDIEYRFELWNKFYIQPHYRHYTQTAADFYHHSLRDNESIPDYASADFRLAKFNAKTVGLKLGIDYNSSSKLSLRYEKYIQTGDSHPDDAVGIQQDYDLYPKLEATIIQLSFSKIF